eukprot:TRINITY_DN78_c0_g1_i2.p1 TRINITY_DN78_c0_g1~~TRINITY_DN78_c0_g1_i2.p1  ORF type:complete len:359 (+),score=65.93 TRINITY_DN78_c0_g1_i2:91-1167(+)
MEYLNVFSQSIMTFNIDDGFAEAIVRGFRKGILSKSDYSNLEQCEVLDDMKMHLGSTDYGEFLQNEPSPLHTVTISEKCTEKLVAEFEYIRAQSVEPLSKFLDYITYGYMIDNIILLITGTLHERDMSELREKCHPLGTFESMTTLCACQSIADLYNHVLVDTPLASYFHASALTEEDLDEMNIEIIRNTLYKAYLEDFYKYCKRIGGPTAEVMSGILEFEADRRAINITINSFGTELTKDDREKLYPEFGLLYPEGTWKLAKADDTEQVRQIVDSYSAYSDLFGEGTADDKSLVDALYEYEVKLHQLSFDQQMQYGVFYSYVKLREQEVRNIVWIAECVSQRMREKISNYIPIFEDY